MHLVSSRTLCPFVTFAVVCVSAPAGAQEAPDKAACVAAYGQAQALRRQGKLSQARKEALTCARAPCPAALQPECMKWVTEIEEATPSVIFEAREADGGRARTDVRVMVDGVPLAERLEGRAVDLDPGEHTFRFEAEGVRPLEQKLLVVEGEKRRKISVELPSSSEKPTPPGPAASASVDAEGPSWPQYVLAGVGILGLGGFAIVGLAGRSGESDLEGCKPRCPSADVDSVRTKYIIADVSLVVGVVASAIATVLFVTRSPAKRAPVTDTKVAR